MIHPTESQMQDFLATDQASPVIFINLHRYYAKARYAAGFSEAGCPVDVSGREAYHRYLKRVSGEFLPQVGARLLIAGPVDMVFIGEGHFDEVVIGRYPSKAHAMRVPSLPGYDEIAVHRTAGLESAQTLVLSPQELLVDILAENLER